MAKLDNIRLARLADLDAVADLYHQVCAHQVVDQYGADWTWGDYPSVAGLREYIEHELVVTGWMNDQLVAAGVLTAGEDDDYRQVQWPTKVSDAQTTVLHLFTVHPDFRRTGIASQMFQGVLHTAKEAGFQVLHLDVLEGNLPSEKLYLKNGCQIVANVLMHYSDIGDRHAKVMEHPL